MKWSDVKALHGVYDCVHLNLGFLLDHHLDFPPVGLKIRPKVKAMIKKKGG